MKQQGPPPQMQFGNGHGQPQGGFWNGRSAMPGTKPMDYDVPRHQILARKERGRTMYYVDGRYVIDLLNKEFEGHWSSEVTHLVCEEKRQDENGFWHVTFSSTVKLTTAYFTKQDVGTGSNIGKNLGQVLDTAKKTAVTDGLKRCARQLGRRFGNCLYDKAFIAVCNQFGVGPNARPIPQRRQ